MGKSIEEKLTNRIVLVHPQLTTDPADRRGQIGRINSIVSDDVVYVRFADGSAAAYQLNALLTLSPKSIILQGLQSNVFTGADLDTYMAVYSLTAQHRYLEALEMAASNETTLFYCTTDCQKWVEIKKRETRKFRNKGLNK